MKIRYERPVSHAATWAGRLGLFSVTLLAVAAAMHRFGVLNSDIFVTVFALSGLIAVTSFLLAVIGLVRLWMVGARGGRASARGMLFSIVVLIPACLVLYRAYTLPQLYDISTDVIDAPEFLLPINHSAASLPFMSGGDRQYLGQETAYPEVTGRRYEGAVDRVLEAVNLVAQNKGIRVLEIKLPEEPKVIDEAPAPADDENSSVIEIAPDERATEEEVEAEADAEVSDPTNEALLSEGPEEDGALLPGEAGIEEEADLVIAVPVKIVLQGETRTLLLGFESDVSIRLSEEAETTFVDMRSVSRFGPHDLGANASIIADFLAALDAELLGISVK